MDTGENLRYVRDLLAEEQAHVKNESAFCVFPLRYVQADDAAETLRKVLGQDDHPSNAEARSPGAFVRPAGHESATPRLTLAVDARRNAILVSAPTDRMGVVERAVTLVDVPPATGGARAVAIESNTYRLSTIEASWLLRFLVDEGGFDTRVRFTVDERSNSLVVSGSAGDHQAIASLIEKVDEAPRQTQVVELRTLDAVQVATTIERLLGRSEGGDFSSRLSPSHNVTGAVGLLIRSDPVGNRLLLRASPSELAEIRVLLAKLGEWPFSDRGGGHAASP